MPKTRKNTASYQTDSMSRVLRKKGEPGGYLVAVVLPGRRGRFADFFAQLWIFQRLFTCFLMRKKTPKKHYTFDAVCKLVRHPRFLAISNGKKHSPPPVLRWWQGGLGGWWLGWLVVGWLGWLIGLDSSNHYYHNHFGSRQMS